MTENTTGTSDQAQEIQNQINQALQELDLIRNTRQVISDGSSRISVKTTEPCYCE